MCRFCMCIDAIGTSKGYMNNNFRVVAISFEERKIENPLERYLFVCVFRLRRTSDGLINLCFDFDGKSAFA